jgi:hypothetical protein
MQSITTPAQLPNRKIFGILHKILSKKVGRLKAGI